MARAQSFLNRFGTLVGLFLERPEVARFIALTGTAGGFQLPDSEGNSDNHIVPIHAPGLLGDSAAVILFRTRHTELPEFSVRLNTTHLTVYTFAGNDPPERSWHEIIPPGALKPRDNELVFNVGGGQGTVVVGDVVILYTSNKLTVRFPQVLAPGLERRLPR